MRKELPVRWDQKAAQSLKDIFEEIQKDSPDAAENVISTLLSLSRTLGKFPEKYSIEPYLVNSPNNYRSVSKWNYKLIYEVTNEEVIVVMLFDGRQDPDKIKLK